MHTLPHNCQCAVSGRRPYTWFILPLCRSHSYRHNSHSQ